MQVEDKLYWFWLCNVEKVGSKKIEYLVNYYGSPKELFYSDMKDYPYIEKITEEDVIRIKKNRDLKMIQNKYDKLRSKGVYFVTKEEELYPKKLKNIYDPPAGLYVKGNLPKDEEIVIAVIGSRNCSDYGREMAIYLSRELAKEGISIISGLARGVDGYAHQGALEAGSITYGVLGCGVDICYPKENINSYMQMQEKGGVLSEYGLSVGPSPWHFPMRNRIISGLSDGILVIEAKEKSGSLITVDMGLEQGKNIYALCGRAYDKLSEGCHNLIKLGGKLVTKPEDILEDFFQKNENLRKNNKKYNNLLESTEKIVYANLSFLGKHMNEIVNETNLPVSEVTKCLLSLKLAGYIKETRANCYAYTQS